MFNRSNIGLCLYSVMLWVFLLSAPASYAQSTVVYQDDFEASVSGWSVNDSDFAPLVTNFLGRFAEGNTVTSRTFTLPANTDELVIEFDLYRFDSWDNSAEFGFDRFALDVDGTEILSLPFPNPQAARSGTTGNVDWSHTPLTGREELGFNSGQFWFDQIHRFVITIDNPGASVALTLRANLSQTEPDESGGYDNFLVTAFTDGNIIQAVAETFVAVDGDVGGDTPSVLTSDTINGVILDPADVSITSTSSSSPNVTLNTSTGFVTAAANTSAGTYTVDYEVCEIIDPANCSSVTETIEVFTAASPPPAPSFCPVGQISVPGAYHVVSASGGQNSNRAEGEPLAEGAINPNTDGAITFFPTITLDLTGDAAISVPEGEVIQIALSSSFSNNARGEILIAADDEIYTSLGTSGNGGSVYGAWTSNMLRYDDFTVPAGGARYIQISHEAAGVITDGVIYSNQCQIPSGEILAVAENFTNVDGDAGGSTPSVLSSDTISGVILDPAEVTITSTSSSNPNVTLDSATGFITVAANTPTGTYTVEYEICEIANPTNCSSVTESLGVFTAAGPPSLCPVGTISVPGTYHVASASGGNNPTRAEGAPFAEGQIIDPNNNVTVTYFPTITLDLTGDPALILPEGEVIEMALSSAFGNNARGEILISVDGVSYSSLGTTGNGGSVYGAWTSNTLRYDDFTVPAGGARFIQISQESGGVVSDGVIYSNQCQIPSGEILAVAETFTPVDGDAGGSTPSVLSSDTISGVILNPAEVTITSTSSSDPNITLDSATGFITVAANTPTGTYTVEYEICEIANPTNCSSVTESLDVFTAAGPPSTCPAGTSQIPGTYHVVSATNHPGQNQNANRSEGTPLAEGTVETGNNSAITFFGAITMDLTGDAAILVPEGEPIDVVLASSFGTAGRAEILMSVDGTSYTSLGTTGNGGSVYGQWQSNILRYDEFIVPAGGARFLRVLQQNSGVRADGVIYGNQCQTASNPVNLSANKTVDVYDPQGLGLYAIPGNDVIYTITIDNSGTGDVDSDSLILIDNMPSEIAFYNGDIDDGGPEIDPVSFEDTGGSLTFDYNTDVRFSNAAAPPANFAACTYTPASGYDEDVTFICLNPKGIMVGQSNVSLSFRSRIL